MAYELIEHVELTSSASSIQFTSIPQDGLDLVILTSFRSTDSTEFNFLRYVLNGDTTWGNYSLVQGQSYIGSVFALYKINEDRFSISQNVPAGNSTANTFGNHKFTISNYTSSGSKPVSYDGVGENDNQGASYTTVASGLYNPTSPITSVEIRVETASANRIIGPYSTASLYKIY